jgi:hypothetical protein
VIGIARNVDRDAHAVALFHGHVHRASVGTIVRAGRLDDQARAFGRRVHYLLAIIRIHAPPAALPPAVERSSPGQRQPAA